MNATLGEIKAEPVLYFDTDFIDECTRFCTDRDIDSLPALDGKYVWIRRDSGPFRREPMRAARCIDPDLGCFDDRLPDLFRRHDVLFVRGAGGLVGAVHWSDYNHPTIATELFNLVAQYERQLRSLAVSMGLNEGDLVEYLRTDRQTDGGSNRAKMLEKMRRRDGAAPEFHVAYLGDLQGLVNSRSELSLDIDAVRHVRNSTMHTKEYINQIDRHAPDFVYDIATFEKLFSCVRIVAAELRRISNRAQFLRGLEGIGEPR